MRKEFGIGLWVIGVAAAVGAADLKQATEGKEAYFTLLLTGLWMATLLYNWLWGSNKGHIAHFLMIVAFAAFQLIYLANGAGLISSKGVGVAAVLAFAGMAVVLWRFLPEIYRNYYNSRR